MRTEKIRAVDPEGYDRAAAFWRDCLERGADRHRHAMLVATMLDVAVAQMIEQMGIRDTGSSLSAMCLDLALLEAKLNQAIAGAGKTI